MSEGASEETRATGPTLYVDQDMDAAASVSVAGGRAAIWSSRCPGKDGPNEDSAAIVPWDESSAVLLVADGLGGGPSGERASRIALEEVTASIQRAASADGVLRAALLDGIERANESVRARAGGGATTLAAVEVRDDRIRPYHVGDSSIYAVGSRGKLKLQTVAHSPTAYAVEAGHIAEEDAMFHEERHVVSNVVGADDMRIELGPVLRLATRDSVLLATDGLVDNLHTDEIVGHLRGGTLEEVVRRLSSIALERMSAPEAEQPSKPDDLTFVVFRRWGR